MDEIPSPIDFSKKSIVYVRYKDHVLYNRVDPSLTKPQTREAIGWLVYECPSYLTLSWDREADPPTLKGGDPKASGLVLLKTDIVELKRLSCSASKPISEYNLNSNQSISNTECALQPTKRKTQRK